MAKTAAEQEWSITLASGAGYFICSACMLLANKVCLYHMPYPGLVAGIQFAVSAFIAYFVGVFGLAKVDKLEMETITKFWKVPACFSLAIFANMKVMSHSNVETFITFRNVTPLLVAVLDFIFMEKALPTTRGLVSFAMIIVGTTVYTATDSDFVLESYLWIVVYLCVICFEMVYVKHIFSTVEMTTFGRVLYTNLLSIPFQMGSAVMTMEHTKYATMEITFYALLFLALSCVGGFGISFSATAFRSRVSATTFTLFGVINKMISVTVNFFMWDKHAHFIGLAALAFTLVGGTLYKPAGPREPGTFSDRMHNRLFPPAAPVEESKEEA